MKNLYRNSIIALSLMFLMSASGVTAQVPVREGSDYTVKGSSKKSMHSKSVQNTNPLLQDYDVKFYFLDIEAISTSDHIGGNTSVLVEVVNNPLSTLVLELLDQLTVDSVLIDGALSVFAHSNHEVSITLPREYAIGERLTAKVYYHGTSGPGMFSEVDGNWDIPVTATLSEPFYARDWFPCKQDLRDKADSVYVFVTTDYGLSAASNGLLTGTSYLPNGKIRYEWKSNYPIAFYLISIAVSDYEEYSIEALPAEGDPILIQNYIYDRDGCLEYYKEGIDMTINIMIEFIDLFGPYPFREEKYGHYLWPWGGGMEHQTMSGMGGFSFYLVAHELGHSWYGDYVTCATWQDIWINEGFATFAGYIALEKIYPAAAYDERVRIYNRALREPEGSVYIPAGMPLTDGRIFSSNLSYNKGMTLLNMIRFILDDDELFFQSLRDYTAVYADSVATGLDFKEELEKSTGMDFTDFFDQWYFGFGFPSFDVSWGQDGDTVTIYSSQTTSSKNTTLFKTPMEYKLEFMTGGDTIVRVDHMENDEEYTFYFDKTIRRVVVDPRNMVLDGEATVKRLAGIESFEQHFALYPNPVDDHFTISPQEDWAGELRIEISNELGQRVYSESIEHRPYMKHVITPGIRTTGLYFVRIISGTNVEIHKIIIE